MFKRDAIARPPFAGQDALLDIRANALMQRFFALQLGLLRGDCVYSNRLRSYGPHHCHDGTIAFNVYT